MPRLPSCGKGKVITESFLAGDVGERVGDAGEDVEVIFAVVERRNAAFPDLQERIRAARGDFQSSNSTHELAGSPKSEYSMDAVIWVSIVTINSTFGLTFLIMP